MEIGRTVFARSRTFPRHQMRGNRGSASARTPELYRRRVILAVNRVRRRFGVGHGIESLPRTAASSRVSRPAARLSTRCGARSIGEHALAARSFAGVAPSTTSRSRRRKPRPSTPGSPRSTATAACPWRKSSPTSASPWTTSTGWPIAIRRNADSRADQSDGQIDPLVR